MSKRSLWLFIGMLFAGLFLAGCDRAATPEHTDGLSATTLAPRPTVTSTATPNLVATQKAVRQATMQAQQTQNAAYHATVRVRRTEASQARVTALALNPTPRPSPTPWPTATPMPTSPSTCRSDWFNFVNGYYGYTICIPTSAQIIKNESVEGYSPEDLPADWPENYDYFEYLNMTYPPGLRVEILYQSGFIKIVVPDHLGGIYVDNFLGGLGEEDGFVWAWTEEEVTIGDQPYTATVLRQCESHAPDAKCGEAEAYSVLLRDGSTIRFGGGWYWNQGSPNPYPTDKIVLLEMLRTYRSTPNPELYCPKPAPYSLAVGGYAYLKIQPPFDNNLRSAPGINQESAGSISRGEVVEVLEGPVCNNSMPWWKVRVLATDLVGWTPEGDHWSKWLIPCDSEVRCGAP